MQRPTKYIKKRTKTATKVTLKKSILRIWISSMPTKQKSATAESTKICNHKIFMQMYIRLTICHNFYWTWGNVLLCKMGHGARRAQQTQVSISFTALSMEYLNYFQS